MYLMSQSIKKLIDFMKMILMIDVAVGVYGNIWEVSYSSTFHNIYSHSEIFTGGKKSCISV